MRIYSWNMLYRNAEQDRAFDFIGKSNFDIFCLQEVPSEFLGRLRTLPYHITERVDVERLLPKGTVQNHLVILSKHPIKESGGVQYPDYWPLLPLRTRLFVDMMPSRFFSRIQSRGGLYADINIGERSIRVFNLHLVLAHPLWRLKEFEMSMAARDHTRPTIVCGDFNILESRHITPLNWLLGGRMSDFFYHRRERTHIERRFVEHELINTLRGTVTHPLSRSQLDHILVSHTFTIKDASVVRDRIGSDHHPILAEVEF